MKDDGSNLSQMATLRLGSLGLSFKVLPPSELDIWAEHPELPAGVTLLSTGTGGWAYGERYVVHDHTGKQYRTVDLSRGIIVEMQDWEISASFVRIFTEEPYPYTSIEQAQAAARQGIMLFSPPLTENV